MDTNAPRRDNWVVPLTWFAVVGPPLLAFNKSPSATFFNEAWGFVAWGVLASRMAGGLSGVGDLRIDRGQAALLVLFGLLSVAVMASAWWGGLPRGLALGALGMYAAACVCLLSGSLVSRAPPSPGLVGAAGSQATVMQAFFAALVFAGAINTGIALFQFFVPSNFDTWWVIRRMYASRASGNLRQPNFLASQLVWALIGLVVLIQWRRLTPWVGWLLGAFCLFGIALSGSRMGVVLVLVLAGWGVFDRRLGPGLRRALVAAPVLLLVFWALLFVGAQHGGAAFGGESQVTKGDLSSSRLGLWRQTLQLIAASPWLGVGWGEFNFAWTLSPMERYSGYTFNHSHNLVLQWAVELGLPLAALVLWLLGSAVWLAWRRSRSADGDAGVARRGALLIVVTMLLHSLSEYPLWFAYFLLPTMFAFGVALAPASDAAPAQSGNLGLTGAAPRLRNRTLALGGWLMALAAALAVYDYQRVLEIYLPHAGSPEESERIANGRQSILYGHLADRLAGIITRPGERSLEPFVRGTHYVLDMRLLIGWALALHEAGDTDRARYIAQRLREFKDPVASQFFARCRASDADPKVARPFQCDPPTGHYTFRDFR